MRIPFLPASRGRSSIGLTVALALFFGLAATSIRAVGIVGEVAAAGLAEAPPRVLLALSPPDDGTSALGPLVARPTRPLESIGPLPLAVNAYTGGMADWPVRILRLLGGGVALAQGLIVALGGLLVVLAHRFVRIHGTDTAAGGTALLLATDWSFLFYKKVLGGTEVLLQAAALLVVWALWSRRWRGGTHGTVAIAVGIGLGLGAKLTFAGTLVGLGVAALLTRRDRPPMKPPEAVRPTVLVGIVLVLVAPLLVSAAHHALLPRAVPSHDTFALQLARLQGGGAMGRESWTNLGWFLGNPLASFAAAWHCAPVDGLAPLRWPTFAAGLAGTFLAWRDRAPSPSGALLRFLSVAAPGQILALFLMNHDLHHLAEATVTLTLWTAMGCDRLASTVGRNRSLKRAAATLLFVLPAMVAGVLQIRATDGVVRTSTVPLFTREGQEALVALLHDQHVDRLVTSDYEVYGVLETLAPDIAVTHTWGAVARKERDAAAILAVAEGGWYLTLRASAPYVYNLRPRALPGATRVAALTAGDDEWAELWKVE